jgi:predicted Zn-dependent peptidase
MRLYSTLTHKLSEGV